MSYEARLVVAEERASAVAGTSEACFQTKLLVEVDRYQVSPLSATADTLGNAPIKWGKYQDERNLDAEQKA